MKIYIASFFDTRERLHGPAATLWKMGHEVVSTWLYEVQKPALMSKEEFWRKLALKDLAEIKAADLLICDTFDVTPRGGREVEFGFALGGFQGKMVYVVGPVRNVFHTLADKTFESWDECLRHIEGLPDAIHQERGADSSPQGSSVPATGSA